MLKLVIALSLVLSASATMAATCDQLDLKKAQDLYDHVNKDYQNGNLSQSSVQAADLNLFEAKYCSGSETMTLDTYCKTKLVKLLAIEDSLEKRFAAGMVSIEPLIDVQTKIRDAKRECTLVQTK
jgi:hypothetical protein